MVPINPIQVGNRYRKDLGDLAPLMESLRDLGMLQPIVVTRDLKLVAGLRPLEAAKRLGLDMVPVRVVEDLKSVLDQLKAERNENTCRKAFAPSEAVALGMELEKLERTQARRRQGVAGPKEGKGRKPSASGKLPELLGARGQTRDKVAKVLGMSGKNYEKAKVVVKADEANHERFGPVVEVMDATGKLDPVFKEVKRQLAAEQSPPSKKEPTPLDLLCRAWKKASKKEREAFRRYQEENP
jgi:ParB family chromosome partitioning protein